MIQMFCIKYNNSIHNTQLHILYRHVYSNTEHVLVFYIKCILKYLNVPYNIVEFVTNFLLLIGYLITLWF